MINENISNAVSSIVNVLVQNGMPVLITKSNSANQSMEINVNVRGVKCIVHSKGIRVEAQNTPNNLKYLNPLSSCKTRLSKVFRLTDSVGAVIASLDHI